MKYCHWADPEGIDANAGTNASVTVFFLLVQLIFFGYVSYKGIYKSLVKHSSRVSKPLITLLFLYNLLYLIYICILFAWWGQFMFTGDNTAGKHSCILQMFSYLPVVLYLACMVVFWYLRLEIVFKQSIFRVSKQFRIGFVGVTIIALTLQIVLFLLMIIHMTINTNREKYECYVSYNVIDFMPDLTFTHSWTGKNKMDKLQRCIYDSEYTNTVRNIFAFLGLIVPVMQIVLLYQYMSKMYQTVKLFKDSNEHKMFKRQTQTYTQRQNNREWSEYTQTQTQTMQTVQTNSVHAGNQNRGPGHMFVTSTTTSPIPEENMTPDTNNSHMTDFSQAAATAGRRIQIQSRTKTKNANENNSNNNNTTMNGVSDGLPNKPTKILAVASMSAGPSVDASDDDNENENEYGSDGSPGIIAGSPSQVPMHPKARSIPAISLSPQSRCQVSSPPPPLPVRTRSRKFSIMMHESIRQSTIVAVISILSTLFAILIWSIFDSDVLWLLYVDGIINGMAMYSIFKVGKPMYLCLTCNDCKLCSKAWTKYLYH